MRAIEIIGQLQVKLLRTHDDQFEVLNYIVQHFQFDHHEIEEVPLEVVNRTDRL
jgi:hypothetical protein